MSRTLDRHRMSFKNDGDMVFGDGESDAKTYSNLLATVAQASGEIAAKEEKKKSDAAKAAADKASHADEDAAKATAKQARKTADLAKIDADTAKTKADAVEKDPNGPLHVAAKKLADKAALADADATAAASRLSLFDRASLKAELAMSSSGQGGSLFTARNVLIGAGVLVGGLVAWKLVAGGSGRGTRGYMTRGRR